MKSSAPSRLLQILEKVAAQNKAKKARDMWAAVFNVDGKETEEILLGIASLLRLLSEAKRSVASTVGEENAKLHMASFHKLERTFSTINLDATPQTLRQGVSEAMQGVRFSADLVERLEGGGEVDGALLASLVSEVTDQIKVLLASDLPDDAKRLLHERLKAVRDAAEHIHLFGIDEFESVLDSALGAVVRCNPDRSKPKQKKVLEGIEKIVTLGLKLIALAQQIPELPGISRRLLGAGD